MTLDFRHRIALELNRALTQRIIKQHPLRQLFWECTLRCNLHCRHCGSDCKNDSAVKDMPKNAFMEVLDDVKKVTDPHKVMVIVTGGQFQTRGGGDQHGFCDAGSRFGCGDLCE